MQTEPKRPAAVTLAPDGTWQVTAPDGSVLAACATNAEAWKTYDKLAAEPLSPREALLAPGRSKPLTARRRCPV
jgi:hypothetical protein